MKVTILNSFAYRKHEDDMARREAERNEYRRKKKKARVVYPSEMYDEDSMYGFRRL